MNKGTPKNDSNFLSSSALFVGVLLLISAIAGCRGCRSLNVEDNEAKDSKGKTVLRIDTGDLQSVPSTSRVKELVAKPGHWLHLKQALRANLSDEQVSINTRVVSPVPPFKPYPILDLPFEFSFDREASLAIGQRKRLSYEVFVPPLPSDLSDELPQRKAAMQVSIVPRKFGPVISETLYPILPLNPYQNCILVLSSDADRYQFLAGLSCMVWPSTELGFGEQHSPFHLVNIGEGEAQESLPDRFVSMTSTSHVVWNDCAPSALTESQIQALVDWLHFGGQLIVNGPESMAACRGTFLESILPLEKFTSVDVKADDWKAFDQRWTIGNVYESRSEVRLVLPTKRKLPMIDGTLVDSSHWIAGCEGFLAERTIGAGRVVMSTFPLGDEMLVRWPSYGSFFHNAVLGQPPRTWVTSSDTPVELRVGSLRFLDEYRGQEQNPALTNSLRILARDLGCCYETRRASRETANPKSNMKLGSASVRENTDEIDDATGESLETLRVRERGDVCRIEHDGPLIDAARSALQQASGITAPRPSKILQLLAGYLFCLVPLNWLVFRILGRVEWAWIAAPFISVIGAVLIARSVQLDIGFSRSQSTINIVELPASHPRGHVSSFTSLYSSLSTNYSAFCESGSGFVLPIAGARSGELVPFSDSRIRYEYAGSEGSGLPSISVRSNSTSLIHGESMVDFGGSIDIDWDEAELSVSIKNNTMMDLGDVGLVTRTTDNRWFTTRIGELTSKQRTVVKLQRSPFISSDSYGDLADLELSPWKSITSQVSADESTTPATPAKASSSRLVDPSLAAILRLHVVKPGEVILVGIAKKIDNGIRIRPVAREQHEESLVVVRRMPARATIARPDAHLPPKAKDAEN
jgi:hypothetical protein